MKFKKWYYRLIKKSPADMPMVTYWKYTDRIEAKVTKDKDGSIIMKMDGEKEPHPGFPRGYLLFGKLSKLKHEIKNQIFNYIWGELEKGKLKEEILAELKGEILDRIFKLFDDFKYDIVPYSQFAPCVKEIHRAWTKAEQGLPNIEKSRKMKEMFCMIIQEDDSYRFRVQWAADYMSKWWNPFKRLDLAFKMLEIAEVISDMKERERLWRAIILLSLSDPEINQLFRNFCKEVDWKKIRLRERDKYHFRGKYFKVDLSLFDY